MIWRLLVISACLFTQLSALDLGVLDADSAILRSNFSKQLSLDTAKETRELRFVLKRLSGEYNNLDAVFEREFYHLSDEQRKARKAEIAVRKEQIKAEIASNRASLVDARNKHLPAIRQELQRIVARYAKDHNLALVIRQDQEILVGDYVNRVDITDAIVEEINRQVIFDKPSALP